MAKKKPVIEVKNLYKIYKVGQNKVRALNGVDMTIYKGEFCSIVGTSGSGKSTMLNMLAGLEKPTKGTIKVAGKYIEKLSENQLVKFRREKVGFIFQSFNLLGTMNAVENVALPLSFRGVPKRVRLKKASAMLDLVGLKTQKKHRPNQMSGGQQQRVAIARALANKPHVLLLDEPLGALDLKLRKDMQKELKAIQKRLGITFIYVTHDQEEALSMSDRVVVMDKGRIQQIGTPEEIYNEPVNAFVADFIGESNIVDAVMIKDYLVSFQGAIFDCLDKGFAPNEPTEAVVRPEDIKICEVGAKDTLTGVITDVVFKGTFFETFVDVNGFIWLIQTTEYHKIGETIGMFIEADAIHVMKRSEYSGEFGDYSSFSDEFDHINDADYDWEAENEQ